MCWVDLRVLTSPCLAFSYCIYVIDVQVLTAKFVDKSRDFDPRARVKLCHASLSAT